MPESSQIRNRVYERNLALCQIQNSFLKSLKFGIKLITYENLLMNSLPHFPFHTSFTITMSNYQINQSAKYFRLWIIQYIFGYIELLSCSAQVGSLGRTHAMKLCFTRWPFYKDMAREWFVLSETIICFVTTPRSSLTRHLVLQCRLYKTIKN